jgi:hypothetical protein
MQIYLHGRANRLYRPIHNPLTDRKCSQLADESLLFVFCSVTKDLGERWVRLTNVVSNVIIARYRQKIFIYKVKCAGTFESVSCYLCFIQGLQPQ